MATTSVARIWIGVGINSTSGTAYGSNLTLPNKLTSSATVNIVVQDASIGNTGYLYCYGGGASKFYLCDSAGNNAIFIEEISLSSSFNGTRNSPKTVDLRALQNKAIYCKEVTSSGNGVHMRGDCCIRITYDVWTDCGSPTTVSVSRSRGVCTVSWSGQTNGTNNAIQNFTAIVKEGSASESGATQLTGSPTTGASLTSSPNGTSPTTAKTYYFGVRSNGIYNTGAYKWSGAVTVPIKPTVSANEAISEDKMDKLRVWINGSQTDVSKDAVAYASHGNTYRNTLTAGVTTFDDAWFTAAANG